MRDLNESRAFGARSVAPVTRLVAIVAAGLIASACSTANSDATAEAASPAFSLPSLPSVASLSPGPSDAPVGSATEIYARVARGANTCWFGAAGPLKLSYIYHAEADAPSRGGKSEIIIHARAPGQPNPRGAKAYRINIEPDGDTAKVKTENLKMPVAMAAAMTADVDRWSKGDQGCHGASTAAGWGAVAPVDPAAKPVVVAGKKAKVKVAAKAGVKAVVKPVVKVP